MKMLDRKAAREALGQMPERTFNLLVSEGLPCRGEGAKARFPWPEIIRWWVDRAKRKAREAARQAAPTTFDDAEKRQMIAKAELAELDLAARRGELMTVAQYDEAVSTAFTRVRAQLLNMPTKMAPELVGISAAPDALAKVQGFVDEVIAELHAGEDVPEPTEDDGDRD